MYGVCEGVLEVRKEPVKTQSALALESHSWASHTWTELVASDRPASSSWLLEPIARPRHINHKPLPVSGPCRREASNPNK